MDDYINKLLLNSKDFLCDLKFSVSKLISLSNDVSLNRFM
jgi:hypothetical protein